MTESASSARVLASLLSLLLLLPGRAGRAGETDGAFGEHYRRAERYYEEGRYAESISELRAAYAIKPLPRLLLNIGQLHLKLRQPREALAAYDAFLRHRPDPSPEVAAMVQAGMAEARAQLAPPPRVPLLSVPLATPRGPASSEVSLSRHWWFWSGLSLLAAGVAAGMAIGLSRPRRPPPPGDIEVVEVDFRALGFSW